MKPSGDHEVDDGVTLSRESQDNAFADAERFLEVSPYQPSWRRLRGPQDKGIGKADSLQRLPQSHIPQALHVDGDIGEFRHGVTSFRKLRNSLLPCQAGVNLKALMYLML